MKLDSSLWSRRGLFRLAFVAAFLLAGTIAAPLGARAVGDVVIDSSSGFYSGQSVVVSSGPLNLRSGAGTDYSIVEVLAVGDYLTISEGPYSANGYQWYSVTVDSTGTNGYAAGVFLSAAASSGLSIGDTVYVTSDMVNVRSGPGTGYSVIDTMVYGQNGLIVDGPVVANGYTWFELTYVGGTSDGWVAGEFLGLVSTGGGFAIGDIVSVNSVTLNVRSGPGTGYSVTDVFAYGDQALIIDGPSSADGYTWYEVTYGGGYYSGWVAGDYLSYVSSGGGDFGIGDTVYVNSDTLNVRSGAGTGYSVIDVLSYGDQATILDGPYTANGYAWYQISYGSGYTGWVAGDYLSYYSSGGFYIGQSVYVTGATLNVRSGAGTGYSVIDTLSYGTNATIVDGPYVSDGYTWYQILYSGAYYGWVAGEYLGAN